jgi:SAM-dependent methyltransferase
VALIDDAPRADRAETGNDVPRLQSPAKSAGRTGKKQRSLLLTLAPFVLAWIALGIVAQFPFDSDPPMTQAQLASTRSFYTQAYAAPKKDAAPSAEDDIYVRVATQAAKIFKIEEKVAEFVRQYGLRSSKVLEIGAGRGYLQDHVADYTGLDISPEAARFFHKPFVLGSATAMPFADSSFDAAWSIWVFEHIPNPEQALRETRRVLKDGAVLYFFPAWDTPSWAAEGLEVRPYSNLTWSQKLRKATVAPRATIAYWALTKPVARAARAAAISLAGGPSVFHYRRLQPNYEKYWMPDSDAVNSLDRRETMLWFTSRGDECLNCSSDAIFAEPDIYYPLVIRIHKR